MLLSGDSIATLMAAQVRVQHEDVMPGRTLAQGVPRIEARGDRRVLVSLGAADVLLGTGTTPQTFAEDVRRVMRRRACVAWLAIPKAPAYTATLRLLARADPRLHVVSTHGAVLVDGFHPDAPSARLLGHRMIRACS